MWLTLVRVPIAALSMVLAAGQVTRAQDGGDVTVFASAGFVDVKAEQFDEGGMFVPGGSIKIALTRAVSTEVSVETGAIHHGTVIPLRSETVFTDMFRQTALGISVVYEAPPRHRFRFVIGGGAGVLFQRWTSPVRDIRPGLCCATLPGKHDAGALHAHSGLAFDTHPRLPIRIEAMWWRAIESTTLGVRTALGWRF